MKRATMLSDDEIIAIVNDVCTKPTAEIGRHVMPLIQHIMEIENKQCSTCCHWVGWNHVYAHKGECLNPTLKALASLNDTVLVTPSESLVLVTPFDWGCKGWTRKESNDDVQSSCE